MSEQNPLIALAHKMADNARDNGYPLTVEALHDFIDRAKERGLDGHDEEESDALCIDQDGVPTEKAVLRRRWVESEAIHKRFQDIVPGLCSGTWEDIWERVRVLVQNKS